MRDANGTETLGYAAGFVGMQAGDLNSSRIYTATALTSAFKPTRKD